VPIGANYRGVPGLGPVNETESRSVYRAVSPPGSIESQVHRGPEGGSEEGLIHSGGSR
jgi:hypothetical protein